MAKDVCPWWLGYGLASPLRKLTLNPDAVVHPYVTPGMLVLEPGPGMGFFTLPLARLAGPKGRVVAVDIQQKMLDALARRAERAKLRERIELRLTRGDALGVEDLAGRVDFALAFAMVHEVPDPGSLFREIAAALAPGGRVLFCEPAWHVTEPAFARSLDHARAAGLREGETRASRSLRSAILSRA